MSLRLASLALVPLLLLTADAAHAAPPPAADDGATAAIDAALGAELARVAFAGGLDGANHRLGDLAFLATFGRLPGPGDSEALRMDTHLRFVRARLARRPATAPALEARRAELLGYLDDYIALAHTPENAVAPFRNPVFIDADGNVCAVGYLIERSAGRALAERVAATWRYLRLEDIAAAGDPELAAWIAGSGFTADELASIQPAYSAPPLDSLWVTWIGPAGRLSVPDGPWRLVDDAGTVTVGAWKGGRMTGRWERFDAHGDPLGAGDFAKGRGHWIGTYPNGATAAEGDYRDNAPNGTWTIRYASGRVAAKGDFLDGLRWGVWSFYHDAPGDKLLARGRYRAYEEGVWEHYDAEGRHLATAWPAPAGTSGGGLTWYDAEGAVAFATGPRQMDGPAEFAVAWHGDGRVRALTLSRDTVALFDARGHLRAVRSPAAPEHEAPLPVAARRRLERAAAAGRDRHHTGRVGKAFYKALAKVETWEIAGLTVFDDAGRVVEDTPARAAASRELDLAAATLGGTPFTPAVASPLLPACAPPAEGEDGWVYQPFCVPQRDGDGEGDFDDGRDLVGRLPLGDQRRLVAGDGDLVVAGINYTHLDRIFDLAYATLVDRAKLARVVAYEAGFEEPATAPAPFRATSSSFEDEYTWTSWGRVLKRHGVHLADVF
ncbi:MAG: hypothetical protein H6745_03455 [Deltaproteobacteria bacterium]|nr:hypothetical protein [Deltaproteobacteria bacterium]